jgi:hypothetical protein
MGYPHRNTISVMEGKEKVIWKGPYSESFTGKGKV